MRDITYKGLPERCPLLPVDRAESVPVFRSVELFMRQKQKCEKLKVSLMMVFLSQTQQFSPPGLAASLHRSSVRVRKAVLSLYHGALISLDFSTKQSH